MRPIPKNVLEDILNDPFYEKCCITGSRNVSFEHCFTYSGRQINQKWAIVPLKRDLNTSHPPKDVKDKCRLISLQRAKDMGELENIKKKFPKKDWEQEYKYLKNKLGSG